MGVGIEGDPEQIEPDPRESPFELPPVECGPLADWTQKIRAFRAVIEQAEYERASAPASQQPGSEG
jgi:hypothetical protein